MRYAVIEPKIVNNLWAAKSVEYGSHARLKFYPVHLCSNNLQ